MTLLLLVELGLASWRLAHMLVHETGPYDVLVRLRELTGIEHDEDNNIVSYPNSTPLFCVFCTSIWTSAILYFLPAWVRKILAASAIACILEDKYGKS
jgi:hypothetical protein